MTNYNDGKIYGWNGGECPVHPETEVRVWFRDGEKDTDMAREFVGWQHDSEDHCESGDVVAFQVTKEHREPKTIWVNEYTDGGCSFAYSTENDAAESAALSATRIAVKYVEVIE